MPEVYAKAKQKAGSGSFSTFQPGLPYMFSGFLHLPFGQHIHHDLYADLDHLIQRLRILAVAFEEAFLGAHIAYKKVFRNLYPDASNIDKLMEHDLFRATADAVHVRNPLHLISGLECLGHAFLLGHLKDEQFHSTLA